MKMVKSLLLSSAAGLFAVAGAQAADLPVKAKAVEYVKICSLYGVGYYYIPGTDTCIKIGGYVRYEAYHNEPGAAFPNYTAGGVFTRYSNTFAQQARFRLTTDVRTQTEYGTLRSYFSFGLNWLNQPNEPYAAQSVNSTAGAAAAAAPGGGVGFTGNFAMALERAFIQFAGFTIGRADSFFAFYNGAAYGLVPMQLDGSSGPAGLNVFAYTWQFGNGLSASLSAEDSFARNAGVIDAFHTIPAAGTNFGPAVDTKGQAMPDIVANLRVDQAWGSAQIMGSLHQVGGRYYSGEFPNGQLNNLCNIPNTNSCNHPDDKLGWAVGAGLTLKMPWDAKDTLSGVIAYAEGHSRAVAFGNTNNFLFKSEGIGLGNFNDGVFSAPGRPIGNVGAGYDGSIQLTTAWGGTVAFEHYWTPALRTAWTFGYLSIEYNDTVKTLQQASGNNCAASGLRSPGPIGTKNNTFACDPDWSVWRATSRTMWNPVANLDVGLEIAYTKLNTAYEGFAVSSGNINQGLAPGRYNITDVDVWSATLRVQRSFWP
jgi:hypothetical protein